MIELQDGGRAIVDVDLVLVARTLWRDLAIDWPDEDSVDEFLALIREVRH